MKQLDTIPAPVHPSVELGPEVISVGGNDCESDDRIADENVDVKSHNFKWDKENPCRQAEVGRFRFYGFWVGGTDGRESSNLPANWVGDGSEIKVCVIR